ncbi:DNA -binding domain-containing protein [Bradyrhizobium sp. HKCCYLS2038]|uniref:DNA -binding domain-containing protein n=1 Tax=unclassified Bradyrhizobium TaxID=2631580 RepID=UPI003EBD7BBD
MTKHLDPDVADLAPDDQTLTGYDEQHFVTYLRLLDAAAEGADWREVSRIVLHRDPEAEPDRTRWAYDSHLARARWLSEVGYKGFLRGPD